MSVLLDTSVVVEILRGDPAAIAYARTLAEPPTCSEITRVEVLRGVRSGERRATEQLLATLRWAPLDEAIARRAGELGRRYRRSHRGIATADLVIAATALEMGLPIATLNVRHFPMFASLAPPYSPTG
ncbi:MAG TPA: type II toxin-antitoxin system VapC family toxin [Candidatus Limnocylindrales bacterium]|nr:type II toxin-antitoxin system VapC family toxin [Candidatus Limnocylindrales bacterium]